MSAENVKRRLLSVMLISAMVLGTMVGMISLTVPNVSAAFVTHNAGNVDFDIDDRGVFLNHIYMGGIIQDGNGFGNPTDANMVFLVFDQDNYDHTGNDVDIAMYSDFNVVPGPGNDTTLSLLMDDAVAGDIDKSYGSFTQTNIPEDPYDVRIHQTTWTLQAENWAIIKWDVENIKVVDLLDARLALYFNAAIDTNIDDDQDAWDAANDTYYMFNQGGGGTYVGFASADTGLPINHYFGSNVNDLTPLDEKETYTAISSASQVHGPYAPGENPTITVGWGGGSGFTIAAGSSKTLPMVMAYGSSVADLQQNIDDARQFYLSTILSITEIADEGTPRVEIYNAANSPVDLTNFGLSVDGGSTYWSGGSWVPNPMPGQDYSVWTLAGGDAFDGTEGDTVGLYNSVSSLLYDDVSFGQEGVAPDPINHPAIGSISRVAGPGGYTTDWVHSLFNMTFGSDNLALPVQDQPDIILNEVMFNPSAPEYGFFEIMYTGSGAVDVEDYIVVCDDVVQFTGPRILDPSDPFAIILQPDLPVPASFFINMTSTGDNVYLYDDSGVLLDMVGWSFAHTQNMTVTRVPDGFGTFEGYEDISSVAAGWVFDSPPTIPLVNIGPAGQFGYGSQGDEIWFNLTITNKMATAELFDLFNESLPNGWNVEIYDETGTVLLTDSDGDGLPDILIPGNNYVNITVKVTIPSYWDVGNYDNTTITAAANGNPAIAYSVNVQTRVYPYLISDKSISPSTINVYGTGYDEEATINLSVTGAGHPTLNWTSQDAMLVIDSSGSMVWNDPLNLRITAAKNYVDKLKPDDRAGVVDLDSTATLLQGLTLNYAAVKAAIDTIDSTGGTSVSMALTLAIDQFDFGGGDPDNIWAIILLTDAEDLIPADVTECYNQADRAANLGTMIFTIWLHENPGPTEEQMLKDIASMTNGDYYEATDPQYLDAIYQAIAAKLASIAGRDIDTNDASPMIRDVLPPWIDYVPGSFSIPPDIVYVNATGYTILEWNVSSISIDQTWSVTFNITSTLNGYVEANNYSASRIYYTNWIDIDIQRFFPKTMINVVIGEPEPPELFIRVVDDTDTPYGRGDNITLYWNAPLSPNTQHYLIYRSPTQTGFDFSSVWVDTSTDLDPINGYFPLTTEWNIPGEAASSPQEYYYCIRTVNTGGQISDTSRTVGMYTTTFEAGVSTFSLPLEPLSALWTDDYTNDMFAGYIKYMPITKRSWVKHDWGMGGTNSTMMETGKGFEVEFSSQTKYTFVGLPGAMILYDNISFGFDAQPGSGDSDSLTASVDAVTGTVTLSWLQPASMSPGDQYFVFRSQTRDGFWGTQGSDFLLIASLPYDMLTVQDLNVAVADTQYYYMVVPTQSGTGVRGVSSYSIGVFTAQYLDQYDTVGIPLRLTSYPTADAFALDVDSCVGINYFDSPSQVWRWHSGIMNAGAFDPTFERGRGYQISTQAQTQYSFVGR